LGHSVAITHQHPRVVSVGVGGVDPTSDYPKRMGVGRRS